MIHWVAKCDLIFLKRKLLGLIAVNSIVWFETLVKYRYTEQPIQPRDPQISFLGSQCKKNEIPAVQFQFEAVLPWTEFTVEFLDVADVLDAENVLSINAQQHYFCKWELT